jgi:hypothetical protein
MRPAGGQVREARVAAISANGTNRGGEPGRGGLRRRWGRVAAGIAVALLGAWLFSALYLSAGDRSDVLVVAHHVDRLGVIQRSDLAVVRMSNDPGVRMVSASRLDEFVGRTAAVDLVAGSLLNEDEVRARGERVVDADEAVVGMLVRPGDAPTEVLHRGAPVSVVVRAPTGSTGEAEEVAGWVFNASLPALSSRERPVEVVVAQDAAASVSAAAAEDRVSIVALGE